MTVPGTLAFLALCLAAAAEAQQITHIDFLAENPGRRDFAGALWIPAAGIDPLVPGFDGFSFLATSTGAVDVAADWKERRATELPSQALDEDSDGRADRIGVHLALPAGSRKIVTLHFGPPDRILRLKSRYAQDCLAQRLQGGAMAVWESGRVAFAYRPEDGGWIPIPKRQPRPILEQVPPSLLIPASQPGFEIFPSPQQLNETEVIAAGPIAAGCRFAAPGWRSLVLISRDDRWSFIETSVPAAQRSGPPAIALRKRAGEQVLSGDGWIAAFAGKPGLGLAIFVPSEYRAGARPDSSGAHHRFLLKPDGEGRVRYAVAAYSEHEHRDYVAGPGETDVQLPIVPGVTRHASPRILLRPPRMDQDAFRLRIARDVEALSNPPRIRRVSTQASTYAALLPAAPGRKSYPEAIRLLLGRLRSRMEGAGGKFWFSTAPDGVPSYLAPKASWGDGYLVSMLWDGYRQSGDEWYRKEALAANQRMLGGEEIEAHATGLNYWGGSIRTYRETGDPRWRDSALKCAGMIARIADPVTGLIPEYGRALRKEPDNPYHQQNYVKIDALVGVPILWWAYEETKDRRYLEAANRHMESTMATLIEPDGAALQQLWLKPGTSEVLGYATSQGYGADSRWARGLAWVLDGFADGYRFTRNPLYREVFRKSARFLEENLPDDLISWYDFDDQGVFWRYRDSSTSAICAYALLRMAAVEPDASLARRYREFGIRIVDALIDRCLTPLGPGDPRPSGMLAHATYTKPEEGEFIWGTFSLLRSLCLLQEGGVARAVGPARD